MNPERIPLAPPRGKVAKRLEWAPGQLDHLGGFYLAPGYSNEYMDVYLATDLQPEALAPDPDEIIEIEKLSPQEVRTQITNGGFQDAKTLACLHLADTMHGILSKS